MIYLLSLTPAISYSSDFIHIIENKDYSSLKVSLYKEQPNVLSRKDGFSILDYAIAKKDKRAAIIIADYNNSSMSQRKLQAIEFEIAALSEQLKATQSKSKGVPEKLEKLMQERDKLKIEVGAESLKKVEKKLEELENLNSKEDIEHLKTKLSEVENLNQIKIKNLENELIKVLSSIQATKIPPNENDKFNFIVNSLESRINSLESQVMPIDIKNATLEGRAIFGEKIHLKTEE